MPFSDVELERLYEKLVTRARSRGVACAITSGMACVAFDMVEVRNPIFRRALDYQLNMISASGARKSTFQKIQFVITGLHA